MMHPGLLAERMSSPLQRTQAAADKLIILTLFVAWPAWLAFLALDAVRFRLSHLPIGAQVAGGAPHPCRDVRVLPHLAREQLRGAGGEIQR